MRLAKSRPQGTRGRIQWSPPWPEPRSRYEFNFNEQGQGTSPPAEGAIRNRRGPFDSEGHEKVQLLVSRRIVYSVFASKPDRH